MKRAQKPPRLFRETIPSKRYERKILKRIPLVNEREYLAGLYRADGESYVREPELPKKDVAHLKRLAKAIKHNHGLFQPVKLGLLAFVAGGVLLFLLLFLSPLLETAIERGLESAFVARSTLEGFTVRPFVPGVSFDTLVVADRNRPMRNLVEIHSARLELDLGQLVRGRVVIREFDAGELRFGTDRISSGALPDGHPALTGRAGTGQDAATTLRDDAGTAVQDGVEQLLSLDIQEIVDAELSRLETPGVVDEQIAGLRVQLSEAQTDITALQTGTDTLRSDASRLLSTDIRSISSVDQLVVLYESSESLSRDATVLLNRVSTVSSDIAESRAQVEGAIAAVSEAVRSDTSGIQDRIPSAADILSGPVAAFVEPRIMAVVDPYRETIDTVLGAFGWLQQRSEDREATAGPGRSGRTVSFPSREYPRFLLERATAGAATESVQYSAELVSLSSNPDLLEVAPTARYEQRHNGRRAVIAAVFDSRENAPIPFDIDITLESQPIGFTVPNAPFSFIGLTGSFDLTAEARLVEAGGETLREELVAFVRVIPDTLQFSSEGVIVERVRSVIERAGSIDIEVHAPATGDRTVRTNLDDPIREEITAFLSEQRDAIVATVEAEVRRRLDEQLARYDEELSQLSALYADLESYAGEARELADQVFEQRAAIENRITGLRGEVEDRVRAEAEAARREAERRAREEADAAAREAESRVREGAGRVIDSIRSPF